MLSETKESNSTVELTCKCVSQCDISTEETGHRKTESGTNEAFMTCVSNCKTRQAKYRHKRTINCLKYQDYILNFDIGEQQKNWLSCVKKKAKIPSSGTPEEKMLETN